MKTHWFALISPKIKPLFLGGGTWPGGGWLTSHETKPNQQNPLRLMEFFDDKKECQIPKNILAKPSTQCNMVYLWKITSNYPVLYTYIHKLYILRFFFSTTEFKEKKGPNSEQKHISKYAWVLGVKFYPCLYRNYAFYTSVKDWRRRCQTYVWFKTSPNESNSDRSTR